MGGCSWCGQLPRFGCCWQELSSPGCSGEPAGTLGTHHHPGPADQTLNLPEPANCRIKTNTQDGCQNFRFNALPMWEPWAGLGRWATFGWDRHQLEWPPPFPAGGRLSARCRPPSLAASGAGPRKERPLVTSLTLRTLSATLSTIRTVIGREIRGLFVVSYAPRAAQERSLFPCRTTYFRLVIPPRGLLWLNDGLV